MSGVEVSRKVSKNQMNICASCMNGVVQTFSHFKEQIMLLNNEKVKLQIELKKIKEDHEEQRQVMLENIKLLKQQLATLKKKSNFEIDFKN